jgi:acyl-CoA oxidase
MNKMIGYRALRGGDIGPKIGWHSKDNSYLYFRNIRVPKENFFTKYAEVSDAGEYKQVGDPRIAYGTMMFVRLTISTVIPKLYAQAIIMVSRYSFFRKQGIGLDKREITILEYQTQQEKVLPRIAEYYAITVAAHSSEVSATRTTGESKTMIFRYCRRPI